MGELKNLNKKENQESLKVTVTLKLPRNIRNFLNDFYQFANTTIEQLLKAELEQTVKDFYQGGFFEKWTRKAFKNRGVSECFEILA